MVRELVGLDQFTQLSFFFQAEGGIRDLVRSRGLGDVYKRQRRQRIATNVPGAAAGGLVYSYSDPDAFGTAIGHDLSLIHI